MTNKTESAALNKADKPVPLYWVIIRAAVLIVPAFILFACINICQLAGIPLLVIHKGWYNSYQAHFKGLFGKVTAVVTQKWSPTSVRVSCDESITGQISTDAKGNLKTSFPSRLIMISNHQIYTDWLYAWWIAYTSGQHSSLYIMLKKELQLIPILGWGMYFFEFIFLARSKKGQDIPNIKSSVLKIQKKVTWNNTLAPMWLMLYPEGTTMTGKSVKNGRDWAEENNATTYSHLLIPRAGGLSASIETVRGSVDWLYDCTMAYEGVGGDRYGEDIFPLSKVLFAGKPPVKVNIHFSRVSVDEIPSDKAEFKLWLHNRWTRKNEMMVDFMQTGRLPAIPNDPLKKGYVEADIKLSSLSETLEFLPPVFGAVAIVYITRSILGWIC